MNGLPQPPGGFDPYGPQFQEDPNQPQQPGLPQPQPPQPQVVPPSPQGQTLGQAGDLAAAGNNPLLASFQQNVQALMPMVQGAMREPLPETSRPGIWANIMTWGGAAAQHHQQEAAYNQGVSEYNKQLQLYAMEMAKDMTVETAKTAALSGQADLRTLGMQLQFAKFKQSLDEATRREAERNFNRMIKGTTGPPSGPDMEAADARGEEYAPAPGAPSRYTLQPKAGGGWSMPGPGPAPGSPAAAALGGGTGAPKSAAETYRANKVADKVETPTAATKTMKETAPKVLGFIQRVREDLTHLKTGPISSRVQAAGTALGLKNPAFKRYETNVGLLQTALMRLHTGSRSSEMMLNKFQGMLDSGKASPQNMEASLSAIEDYANDILGAAHAPDQQSTSGTPSTPGQLGTPRRLSSGKLILEEP